MQNFLYWGLTLTLNVNMFYIRVRSGDIYFSVGEVLTLNVKNCKDLKNNAVFYIKGNFYIKGCNKAILP